MIPLFDAGGHVGMVLSPQCFHIINGRASEHEAMCVLVACRHRMAYKLVGCYVAVDAAS